jgi:hypothetical protein
MKRDFSQAKFFVDSAIVICDNKCSNDILIEADFCLGDINYGIKKWDVAEKFFLKSYLLARQVNNIRFQLDNINRLSTMYIQSNQNEKAIQYLKEAEDLIKPGASFNLELIKIYSAFSRLYNNTKSFKKVAFYQQKYIQLKDSVYNDELTANLMKIEARHIEAENQAKIEAQNQILELKEQAIHRQKILNIVIVLFGLVGVAFIIVLFKRYRQKKIINELLNARVTSRTKELEANRNELMRHNEERDILIARTTQDIRSSLATLKGICSIGLKDISDENARDYLFKIEEISNSLSNALYSLKYGKGTTNLR